MRKIKLQCQDYQVDDLLADFKIEWKSSSVVDFIGDDSSLHSDFGDVFIQFKNGKSYIYKNVSKAHIDEMYAAESIGRLISVLSKNYTYVPLDGQLVKPVADPLAVASGTAT